MLSYLFCIVSSRRVNVLQSTVSISHEMDSLINSHWDILDMITKIMDSVGFLGLPDEFQTFMCICI